MSILILNGKTSRVRPNQDLLVNKHDRFEPPIINGYMPTDVAINGLHRLPILSGCVLDLPLYHPILSPSSFKSLDANQHSCTVTGAIWLPQGRTFDGNDDYIEATCPQLDFTTGAFSGVIWVYLDAIGAYSYLMARGFAAADGWFFMIEAGGYLEINTSQAGANQQSYSAAGTVTTGSWLCLGFTRDGAVCKVYINGVDSTAGSGAHINPLTSARTLKIGVDDNLASDLDGLVGEVQVYNRALSSAEILRNYQSTKWRYL
uniref:Putative structural protein n=1 Tax=viral metagenome TaxID=1070528 RepID=A0A6M3KFZ5_9ZZZZ